MVRGYDGIRQELNRGRGDAPLSSYPVALEPPYSSYQPGRRGAAVPAIRQATPGPLRHLRVRLPREDMPPPIVAEQLLLAVKPRAPVAFEVVGYDSTVAIQFTCAEADAPGVRQQLVAAYPAIQVAEAPDALARAFGSPAQVRSYGLKESPVFTVKHDGKVDQFIALAGVLGNFQQGVGALQVLFQPVAGDWRTNLLVASRDPFDPSKSPYQDVPDFPKLAEKKTAKPFFVVSLRLIATSAAELDRLEGFLAQFDNSNGFIRLRQPERVPARHALE